MDVTCDRCSTRYEFDEALVSSRGTTVKCTNCGNQFKVFRPDGSSALTGWTIRTVDGRELVFKAMRELQAAISGGDVTLEDVLIPGDGSEPRRLSRIEELQSFFGPDETTKRQRRAKKGDTQPPRFNDDEPSMVSTNAAGSHVHHRRQASTPTAVIRDRVGKALPSQSGDTLPPPSHLTPNALKDMAHAEVMARRKDEPSQNNHSEEPADGVTRVRVPPEPPTLQGKRRPPRPTTDREDFAPDSGIPMDKPSSRQLEAVDALNDAVNRMLSSGADSKQTGSGLADGDVMDVGFEESTEPRSKTHGRKSSRGKLKPREKEPSFSDEDTIGDVDSSDVDSSDGGISGPTMSEPKIIRAPRSAPKLQSVHPLHSQPPVTPTPSAARPSILRSSEMFTDPRFSSYSPRGRRPGMARWVIGLIGAGLLGLVGFTLFKRYALAPTETVASASPEDGRINKFLDDGRARLAAGDIEGAKDQYTKASGIAEADPRVAHALAHVEVIRTDLLWLHMRLLDDDDSNRAMVAQQLGRALGRAEEAAADASKKSSGGASTVALSIDILRMQGKGGEARKLVSQLKDGGADSGRVLAALDLIESSPNYGSVIDRLRSAMRAEKKLGRAHALLIYALVLSGKNELAEKELASLAAQNATFSLLEALKHFVDDDEDDDDDDDDDDTDDDDDKKADGDDKPPTDYRDALRQARSARKRGDLDNAEQLYRVALKKSPGNSEALAGLADVARDRGDSGSAEKRYQQMLDKNPGYVPALMGLADIKWANGNRAGALALYRQVVSSAPDSSYGQQARQRIEASNGGGKPAAQPPSPQPPSPQPPSPQPPPPSSEPKPSTTAAPVDTSDLPGEDPPPPAPAPAPKDAPDVDTSDLPEYQ